MCGEWLLGVAITTFWAIVWVWGRSWYEDNSADGGGNRDRCQLQTKDIKKKSKPKPTRHNELSLVSRGGILDDGAGRVVGHDGGYALDGGHSILPATKLYGRGQHLEIQVSRQLDGCGWMRLLVAFAVVVVGGLGRGQVVQNLSIGRSSR